MMKKQQRAISLILENYSFLTHNLHYRHFEYIDRYTTLHMWIPGDMLMLSHSHDSPFLKYNLLIEKQSWRLMHAHIL